MAFSLRVSDEDAMLIKKYADMHGISVSDLLRQAVLEKIEDELDLKAYENAKAEFESDGTTYSLDEVEKELGFK